MSNNPADYIFDFNVNGLDGRVLYMPARAGKGKLNILFIYGHHSSLERWWGLVQVLSRYGNVTMPDLPGFGGMDSLYKIDKQPTIDNLADYIAAVIKLRYKKKKIVLAGMSFGFVIATRMLQKYPELSDKVELIISVVGFAHYDDFTFSKARYNSYLWLSRIMSLKYMALFFRYVCLNSVVLRLVYSNTHNAKHKFAQAGDREQFDYLMKIEVGLWQDNDVRTYMYTTTQFLTVDNCNIKVDVPLWHVSAKADHYFDHRIVEQHLRVVFKNFNTVEAQLQAHAPSVLANVKMAEPLFPKPLLKVLASLQ
jgi:pimeloyl-ACP methyl ester carboxylesterase